MYEKHRFLRQMGNYYSKYIRQPFKQQKEKVEKFVREVPEQPLLTSGIVLFFLTVIIVSLSASFYINDRELFYENILIEAHGMLFDLLIIGILLVWLNKNGEKQIRIKRFMEEIDDYRHWKSEEASYKIIGNIKRLNKDKITQIELYNTYLKNANLNYVDLTGSNMNYVVLDEGSLINAMLNKVRLNQASLKNAKLNKTEMKSAFLGGANCEGASMIKCDLENAQLIKTNLRAAFMMDANLKGAMVAGADFTNANLMKADLRGVQGLTSEQLSSVRSLAKALLDPELEVEMKENHPHLFDTAEGSRFELRAS
jgi:BTB/POZ domain-containing protein KCTD9